MEKIKIYLTLSTKPGNELDLYSEANWFDLMRYLLVTTIMYKNIYFGVEKDIKLVNRDEEQDEAGKLELSRFPISNFNKWTFFLLPLIYCVRSMIQYDYNTIELKR